jgi:hypothetical protein
VHNNNARSLLSVFWAKKTLAANWVQSKSFSKKTFASNWEEKNSQETSWRFPFPFLSGM